MIVAKHWAGLIYKRAMLYSWSCTRLRWRQSGCEGWGYADVLPYFKRLENYSGGESEYRGGNGPLAVHRPKPQNPLYKAFLDAGSEAGYPVTDDICGYRQEGFGVFIEHDNERTARRRPILIQPTKAKSKVITDAQVQDSFQWQKLLVLATRKQMERPLKLRHRKKSS